MDQEIPVDQKINSVKAGESMDSDPQVISELFTIADIQNTVDEIDHCLSQLIQLHSAQIEGTMEADNWQGMEAMLWEERREHQEQLRTINQDINQLEMMLRPFRQEFAQRKSELAERANILEAKLDEANNNIFLGQQSKGELLTKNESNASNEQIVSSGSVQYQLFLALFQQLLQQHNNHQGIASNWPHSNEIIGGDISNKPGSISADAANILSTVFPIQTPISLLPNPHQPKMKACQHCQRSIHRNAPQCPFCKQKIISKAAKRARR